jgi:hypothetical protein
MRAPVECEAIAADGICSWTLNFGLSIPVRKWAQLAGPGLAHAQARWKDIKLLIIDEKSMVGRNTFGKNGSPFAPDLPRTC